MQTKFYAGSLATDGRSHLFMLDSFNFCIHVVSVTDGGYQGAILKKGEHGLRELGNIGWCENISTLIIQSFRDKVREFWITAIKVEELNSQ